MINALYIVSEDGTCIYTYRARETKRELDEQLISGFLLAVRNIAKEAFLDKLQRLEMGINQLVYGYKEQDGVQLYAALISDTRDHPDLLGEILEELLTRFVTEFKEEIDNFLKKRVVSKKLKKFDGMIKETVDSRLRRFDILKPRDEKTFVLAIAISLLLFNIGFGIAILLQNLYDIKDTAPQALAVLIFVGCFFIPGSTAGAVIGNGRHGIRAAIIAIILGVISLAAIFWHHLSDLGEGLGFSGQSAALGLILALLFLSPAYGLLGYFAGSYIERRTLYPLLELEVELDVELEEELEEEEKRGFKYKILNLIFPP